MYHFSAHMTSNIKWSKSVSRDIWMTGSFKCSTVLQHKKFCVSVIISINKCVCLCVCLSVHVHIVWLRANKHGIATGMKYTKYTATWQFDENKTCSKVGDVEPCAEKVLCRRTWVNWEGHQWMSSAVRTVADWLRVPRVAVSYRRYQRHSHQLLFTHNNIL